MLDLDMDIPVLDMDVSSMVKQLIYASKSSKMIFFDSVPSIGIGISCSNLINMITNICVLKK